MDPRSDEAPREAAGVPWTARLADLLRRAGVPVARVAAGDGELAVDLADGEGGVAATVRVVPLSAGGAHYRATERYGYRYAAPGPVDAALHGRIDLVVGVLARLESRLPDGWTRPGSGGMSRAFSHRFPFASVDRSVGEDGRPEDQVLVRLTTRCNQSCAFCSAPDCAEPADDALAACLEAAASELPGCLLTLTGGEPSLRKGWEGVLATALSLPGVGGVQVQTNAVTFAAPGAAARVPADPRLLWFVSLHAVDEALYDRMTASRGQLPRALAGLRALLAAGHRVIVNAVVGSANAAHLADLATALPGLLAGLPLPQLHVSVLMCPPHRPSSDEWLIPYEDLVPLLERAVAAAAASGLPMSPLVSSTHASIPPCFVSEAQRARMRNRPVLSPDETGYEDPSRPWVKAKACRSCEADGRCLGVPAPYARRFGLSGLRPFGQAGGAAAPDERVVPVSEATLAALDGLVPDALDRSLRPGNARLVLDLLDPDRVAAPDRPVAFRTLLDALPAGLRALLGATVHVRSRAGRPACLFPDVAEGALLGGPGGRTEAGGTFGPACDGCAARAGCGGVSASYARVFGTGELVPFARPVGGGEPTWQDRARWLLVDHPGARVAVARLVPPGSLPAVPCTRPWTRLEMHDGGTFGPCCADYMAGRHFAAAGATPADLWASDLLRTYRVQMLAGGHPAGCRATCPVLQGGLETPARLVLQGGPAAAVENRIRMVEALLAKRLDLDHGPASVCVPVTSFCNYDCLMCECGERGTLEDQRPAAFWAGLDPCLAGGADLDVNGGEPLASPVFREYLAALAASGLPPVVGMVTNGSLLTPEWLASLPRIPFRALTISLNAATPATYRAVNRGLPWERVRRNLDALLEARREGRYSGGITYSMVVLRANLHEVAAFAALGLADGVPVRYLLPQRDRNRQSVLTSADTLTAAAAGLREAAALLRAAGQDRWADEAGVQAGILEERLSSGVLEPIGNVD